MLRSAGPESVLRLMQDLIYRSPCTEDLALRLQVLQLELPDKSYFLLQGNAPRQEVEKCLAPSHQVQLRKDGELLVIAAEGSETYAAWRGDVIIAGGKDAVTAATGLHDPALAKTWHDRLANLPPGKMAMWKFAFRIAAEFGDAAQANQAKAQLATGQVPPGIDPPPAIAEGLRHANATTSGVRLDIVIDQDTFHDVDLPTLQSWIADATNQLKAAAR